MAVHILPVYSGANTPQGIGVYEQIYKGIIITTYRILGKI
jgi:hypothetical protein